MQRNHRLHRHLQCTREPKQDDTSGYTLISRAEIKSDNEEGTCRPVYNGGAQLRIHSHVKNGSQRGKVMKGASGRDRMMLRASYSVADVSKLPTRLHVSYRTGFNSSFPPPTRLASHWWAYLSDRDIFFLDGASIRSAVY